MEHVTIPKLHNELFYNEVEELDNFFTRKELEEFLKRAKEDMSFKDYTLFRLLAFTGMRKGEALALHWSDIDFKGHSLFIRKTLSTYDGKQVLQQPKTANSRRVIDIDKVTLSILEDWQALQRKDYTRLGLSYTAQHVPVFTRFDKEGEKMKYLRLASPNDTLAKFFKNHLELPKITVHGFRHTHASLLFEAGATIKAVQAQLGHKDIQTTMDVYTHVSEVVKEKTTKLLHDYIEF